MTSAAPTVLSPMRMLGRLFDAGLTALGETCLDSLDVRHGRPSFDPGCERDGLDEEACLIVALYCAAHF